jgi:hypothetical protein
MSECEVYSYERFLFVHTGTGEKYPTLRKQLMALLPTLPSPELFVAQSIALTAPSPGLEQQDIQR